MTDEEKEAYLAEQKAKAEKVLEKAKNGEDFKALSDEYTAENAGFEFSFDKNGYDPVNQSSMVEPFYTAAWELEEGQILSVKMNDGEPDQNVPRSIKEEGHQILKLIDNKDGTYNLIVKKVGD